MHVVVLELAADGVDGEQALQLRTKAVVEAGAVGDGQPRVLVQQLPLELLTRFRRVHGIAVRDGIGVVRGRQAGRLDRAGRVLAQGGLEQNDGAVGVCPRREVDPWPCRLRVPPSLDPHEDLLGRAAPAGAAGAAGAAPHRRQDGLALAACACAVAARAAWLLLLLLGTRRLLVAGKATDDGPSEEPVDSEGAPKVAIVLICVHACAARLGELRRHLLDVLRFRSGDHSDALRLEFAEEEVFKLLVGLVRLWPAHRRREEPTVLIRRAAILG